MIKQKLRHDKTEILKLRHDKTEILKLRHDKTEILKWNSNLFPVLHKWKLFSRYLKGKKIICLMT
jgi:hypothetical protein